MESATKKKNEKKTNYQIGFQVVEHFKKIQDMKKAHLAPLYMYIFLRSLVIYKVNSQCEMCVQTKTKNQDDEEINTTTQPL